MLTKHPRLINVSENSEAKIKSFYKFFKSTYCRCSVARSCPTLYDPMNCSMPDFPVLHYLPEFAKKKKKKKSTYIQQQISIMVSVVKQ